MNENCVCVRMYLILGTLLLRVLAAQRSLCLALLWRIVAIVAGNVHVRDRPQVQARDAAIGAVSAAVLLEQLAGDLRWW